MRPIRLELEGFGAFRHRSVVDFSDIELVALVGPTGAGKSTLIDAITFALYGSVSRYDDRKAVAPVINQLSNRARVCLDFELGGEAYTVARLVQRTPRGASTKEARLERVGEAPLASDAKAVTAEVTRLLGLDVEQFNRTVVLPQGRFADFLHDNPADRQATLRQLLGFDVYRRIAINARQRAAAARSQVDALRPDLDAADAELTDARRHRLVVRRDELAAARAAFIERIAALAALEGDLAKQVERLTELDTELALLEPVHAPEGLLELDQQLTDASLAVEVAAARLTAAHRRRAVADEQATGGPDLATCRLQLHQHEQAAQAADEHAATGMELKAAEERLAIVADRAAVVSALQQSLQAQLQAATAAERAARAAVDRGPDHARVEQWLATLARRTTTQRLARVAAADATAAGRAVDAAAAVVTQSEASAAAARGRWSELHERAGAAGYRHLLAVGDPCPLCLRSVDELPAHEVDGELDRAAAALAAATSSADTARRGLGDAQRRAAELAADAAAHRRAVEALDAELRDVPDEGALEAELVVAQQLRATSVAAGEQLGSAEAALAAHRDDSRHVELLAASATAEVSAARWRTMEETQRARLDALHAALADVPGEAEVRRALDVAEGLAREQRAAIDEVAAAERQHQAAASTHAEVTTNADAAERALHAARDRLSALGPPVLAEQRLAVRWAVLVDWATARHVQLAGERAGCARRREDLAVRSTDLTHELRVGVAAVLPEVSGPPSAVRDQLTRAEESAARAVDAFDERRVRADVLRARVEALVAERAVADELGRLLRADGFLAWLTEAVLVDLADRASERLHELSGGQFSLEAVEQELMVRDHVNADELRSARTLSGGETFLAALSLALALADATAERSSDGAPQIESIFLDEGFGTLDPDTLDVVASTIEELGSAGRMVAVVTHLRELADRIPVRLEVTRDSTSSRVQRVDV